MYESKLLEIEQYLLAVFRDEGTGKILAKQIFDRSMYTVADLVRAIEHLERTSRLLIRYTKEGDDWVMLTAEGAKAAGVKFAPSPEVLPHPPQSST